VTTGVGVLLLVVGLTACTEAGRADGRTTDSAAVAPTAARGARPGIRFDPAVVRPGTTVGELVVDSIETRRTVVNSTIVGVARFRGEIQLSGLTLRHPDADLRTVASCFEADSASAAQMPRWSGDERRSWFCFENRDEAIRALGPPSEGIPATVVIGRFTIHRGVSDEVNSARLVRVIKGGRGAPPAR
jgi:hypothetical protein